MKIQLINPPALFNPGALTALRPSLPLGLAYIAAILEKGGYKVGVIDAISEGIDRVVKWRNLYCNGLSNEDIIKRIKPDTSVIGIGSMFSFSWLIVRELIKEIRKSRPDLTIICGGEHFTGLAEYTMKEAPIDFVVMGEGEQIILELLDAIASKRKDYENIPGISWRRNGKIQINPRKPRIKNIDNLPWPAWHLFDVLKYDKNNLIFGVHYGRTIPILATRGCPYQCTFCSSPHMWGKIWCPRNPIDVVDEIESYYKKYQATNFPFQDLTAIIKKDWILKFCKELMKRNLKITWQLPSGTRCEVIDDEVADLCYRSGGLSMTFAPESGSEKTRKLIKKQMSLESLYQAVRACVRHKLNISCFIVIAFPKDEEEDVRKSVKLVRKLAMLGIDDIGPGFFFPVPDSELCDYLIKTKRVTINDNFLLAPVCGHDFRSTDEYNYCENISTEKLSRYYWWIIINFYVISFVFHPGKAFRLVCNFIKSREETKLDCFMQETKRKIKMVFKKSKKYSSS